MIGGKGLIVDITQLKPGESGIVVEIGGGFGFTQKVQNLGIRPGKKITKVSSHFGRGPQTIKVDNSRVALGFGMAKKIMIKI